MTTRQLVPLAAAAVMGCQNYDLHHVTATPVQYNPITQTYGDAGPPDIMIVQDKSGSMCEPIDAGGGACAGTGEVSKMALLATDIAQVFDSFLLAGAGVGPFNLGLTAFPVSESEACTAPSSPLYPLAPYTTSIPNIVAWYQSAMAAPGGGTPTAQALLSAATDPGLAMPTPGSARYIILLTDGYPNCSATNACATDPSANLWTDGVAHGCESPSYEDLQNNNSAMPPSGTCGCGNGSCSDPAHPGPDCCIVDLANSSYDAQTNSEFCLDDVATDNALTKLLNQGITTYVVGVGGDFNGNTTVLDAMAYAGSNGLHPLYLATDEPTLLAAIEQIVESALQPCQWFLNPPPTNDQLIGVTLDGNDLTNGDPVNGFTYDPSNQELALGTAACMLAKNGQTHVVQIGEIVAPQ